MGFEAKHLVNPVENVKDTADVEKKFQLLSMAPVLCATLYRDQLHIEVNIRICRSSLLRWNLEFVSPSAMWFII